MSAEFLQEKHFVHKRFGPYVPIKKIGEGRDTVVVLARPWWNTGRDAVKIYSPDPQKHSLKAVESEATTQEAVSSHQHILSLRKHGVVHVERLRTLVAKENKFIEPDFPYIASMFANLGSLRKVRQQGKTLSSLQIVALGTDLLDAIAYAHQTGYMHLDIKPENILRHSTDDGVNTLVADWGSALPVRRLDDSVRYHTVQGTRGYIAPEQRSGKPIYLSDMYSSAVTLWEMMTGEHPFANGRSEIPKLSTLFSEKPSREVEAIDDVLRHAMSPDPRERARNFGTIVDFKDALTRNYAEAQSTSFSTGSGEKKTGTSSSKDSDTTEPFAPQTGNDGTRPWYTRIVTKLFSTTHYERSGATSNEFDPRKLFTKEKDKHIPTLFTAFMRDGGIAVLGSEHWYTLSPESQRCFERDYGTAVVRRLLLRRSLTTGERERLLNASWLGSSILEREEKLEQIHVEVAAWEELIRYGQQLGVVESNLSAKIRRIWDRG